MTSIEHLINFIEFTGYFGYGFLFLIIFFESFPPTLFLPGDSLLFTSGFLASQGYFDVTLLMGILFLASVLGYVFSYAMGEKFRAFILRSNDKYWFKKKHIEYTEEYYKKYGTKTIIIGRFIPIVRSFSPTLAGTSDMNYKKFLKYTLIGGILWTGAMTGGGFYLGKSIPDAEKFFPLIVFMIIFVSLLPAFADRIIEKVKKVKNKKNIPLG